MRHFTRILFGVVLISAYSATAGTLDTSAIYDANPNHLWNRLNKTLFERTATDGNHYGLDQLDILYWARTTNLLTGVPLQAALAVLDEFNQSHGEKLIQDPLKKALLQRDLWALFDWAAVYEPFYLVKYPIERRELVTRLAVAIRRLELTTNEIASLPDNYALAETNHLVDLPRGLFNTNGGWINIAIENVFGLVPMHDLTFGGRSQFVVLFHDADGRKAGLDYLNELHAVEPMMIVTGETNNPTTFNHFPQFPANSQWALVRRMRVIDTDGKIQTTHVVESIELRTYMRIDGSDYVDVTNADGSVHSERILPQRFNDFQMTRPTGKMISLGQKERAFIKTPFSKGIDVLELPGFDGGNTFSATNNQPDSLQFCYECHSQPGIYSVNSFTRIFSLGPFIETTKMVESDDFDRRDGDFLFGKEGRVDWGLLQGLWMQQN